MKHNDCQHKLPDINSSDELCIADFNLRKKDRITYPGACSLEYQNVIKILIEDLLQWDPVKQKAKGKGVLGTVVAFAPADEEQGRKTLHSHWQIWTKELNSELRDDLFAKDPQRRATARKKFFNIVDHLMHTRYECDLEVELNCNRPLGGSQPITESPTTLEEGVNHIFRNIGLAPITNPPATLEDRDKQIFRNARHKGLSKDIKGHVIQCAACDTTVPTADIINFALGSWRELAIKDGSNIDVTLPLHPARLDIVAYRHSYDMEGGCVEEQDPFWGDKNVRDVLLRQRFDEHEYFHRVSCFKKGLDCRFFLPQMSCQETCIYPNEDSIVTWFRLKGDDLEVPSWMLMTRRPMGCQYLNTHNKSISEVINCNTNIQIGDRSQVFYSTMYCGKNTQKEDAERQQRIMDASNRRLFRIQGEIIDGKRKPEEIQDGFVEGLCRLLSGLNAATTRNVISATMQHLLICNGGSRFQFSHGFGVLLIGQLEASLEKWPIDVRLRSNIVKGEKVVWPDNSSDDYLHRPRDATFEGMCSYEMAQQYKKTLLSRVIDDDSDDEEDGDIDETARFHGQGYSNTIKFCETHPGRKFCNLGTLKLKVIPKVYMPQDKLCNIKDLKIKDDKVDAETMKKREDYAKMALLMFYPLRNLDDIKLKNSYWELFHRQLKRHQKGKSTTFWPYGFTILQNIQDRITMDNDTKRARDYITATTTNEAPPDEEARSPNSRSDNFNDLDDILKYCRHDR